MANNKAILQNKLTKQHLEMVYLLSKQINLANFPIFSLRRRSLRKCSVVNIEAIASSGGLASKQLEKNHKQSLKKKGDVDESCSRLNTTI